MKLPNWIVKLEITTFGAVAHARADPNHPFTSENPSSYNLRGGDAAAARLTAQPVAIDLSELLITLPPTLDHAKFEDKKYTLEGRRNAALTSSTGFTQVAADIKDELAAHEKTRPSIPTNFTLPKKQF